MTRAFEHRVLVVRIPADPDDPMVEEFIDDEYPTLRDAVGGYIEAVRISPTVHMWVDEDGIGKELPLNPRATMLTDGQHLIVGPAVLAGNADLWTDGEEHDVPQGLADYLAAMTGWKVKA